jgi:uracil-DNA glycosylase family 4
MSWNEHQAGFLRELGVRWVRGTKLPAATGPAQQLGAELPSVAVASDTALQEPAVASNASAASALEQGKEPVSPHTGAQGGLVATAPPTQPRAQASPPILRPELARLGWSELQKAVASCQACGLCASRKQTVFGVGSTRSQWMVVGEAPGEQEDLKGEPFVGAAGRLLDQMLRALQLTRNDPLENAELEPARQVYIVNSLKCRPPGNRNPQPEELQQCEPYLQRQLELLQPRIILAMGRFAVQSLLRSSEPIGKLRGSVHRYQGVPLVVTYHPAYLLRNPLDKAKAWADLCLAADTFDRETAAALATRDSKA